MGHGISWFADALSDTLLGLLTIYLAAREWLLKIRLRETALKKRRERLEHAQRILEESVLPVMSVIALGFAVVIALRVMYFLDP